MTKFCVYDLGALADRIVLIVLYKEVLIAPYHCFVLQMEKDGG